MTTNAAGIARDEKQAEATQPPPTPAPRKPLHVRALGFVRNRIGRVLHRIDRALLPLAAASPFRAKVYYLFNPAFEREQHATLSGRWHHIRHVASSAVAAVVVRRNIHRLEKGLCMVPARDRFALEYIDETLTAFGDLLKGPQAHEQPLIRYAHDVLSAYFAATRWAAAAPQPNRFERLSAQAREQIGAGTPAVPAAQQLLPPTDVSYTQFLTLTQRRASVRNFKPIDVPRAAIEQAVAAAAQAPSACNRQPLRYIAVADNPTKLQLARLPMGTAGYAEGIPLMLAVVGDLSAYPFERDRHIIYIDASLANMQFMLALETLGLASCSINWPDMEARERKAAALLKLAPYERIVMLMAVGYPDPTGLVPHSEKKSVEEMLSWM
jgi:nitroreductase